MKAVICTKYGGPEVLQLCEVAKPVTGENEILIKIAATAVTASDCIIRSMNLPFFMKLMAKFVIGFSNPSRAPILGLVLSGTIEAIGDKVTQFEVGDNVYAHTFTKFGAYAEYITLMESSAVTVMPENLSFQESAAIPYGGTLALYYLEKANFEKGQNVLVYGASGAIGSLAVQIAKEFGGVVDGVCSKTNIELVKSLGAVSVYDYTSPNFKLESQKYDLIFDAVGKKKSSNLKYKHALKPNGKFISVDHGSPGYNAISKQNLNVLKNLVESNRIKPVIDSVHPLENIVEAHRYVDTGHKKGNVIIAI